MSAAGLRVLARAGSRVERVRLGLLVGAVAAAGALVLAVGTLVGLPETPAQSLAPFAEQAGLRRGTIIAGLLLGAPLLLFAVQGLRCGSAARSRRLDALRTAGAEPAQLRRIAAAQTGRAGLLGGLLAGPVYLLLWVALGVLPERDLRLLPVPRAIDLAVWAGVVALGAVAGAWAGTAAARPARRSDAPAPFTRWIARRTARRGDPASLLAAARLTADPHPAGRTAGLLAVCGAAFAVQAAVAAGALDSTESAFYLLGSGLAGVVTVVAAAVLVGALVVAVADGFVEARRSTAALLALGAEPALLRRVARRQLVAVGAPAAAGGALLGGVLGAAYVIEAGPVGLLAVPVAALLAAGVVVVVARLAVAALGPVLDGAGDPENLRTP